MPGVILGGVTRPNRARAYPDLRQVPVSPAVCGFAPVVLSVLFASVACGGGSNENTVRSVARDPAYSPDGRKIAFTRVTPGGGRGLYVMNADGSNWHRLTLGIDTSPAWSPDGTTIAFKRSRGGKSEIYVMNADGSNQHPLTRHRPRPVDSSTDDPAEPEHPTWSPDGRKIAFTAGDTITIINADGSNRHRLTGYRWGYGWDLAWSPDGRKIAALRQGAIFAIKADGTGLFQVTHSRGEDTVDSSPAWSPDGKEIAFVRDEGNWGFGPNGIFVVNVDGSNERRLTKHEGSGSDDDDPDWSPDGRRIAFTRCSNSCFNAWIYVMNADGSDQRQLTK
jgi:Tol biopolymer transport system component